MWQCKGPDKAGHSGQRSGGWSDSICQVLGRTMKLRLRQDGATAHRWTDRGRSREAPAGATVQVEELVPRSGGGKDGLSDTRHWGSGIPVWERCFETELGWITDQMGKAKRYWLYGGNTGDWFHDLEVGKDFLNETKKHFHEGKEWNSRFH